MLNPHICYIGATPESDTSPSLQAEQTRNCLVGAATELLGGVRCDRNAAVNSGNLSAAKCGPDHVVNGLAGRRGLIAFAPPTAGGFFPKKRVLGGGLEPPRLAACAPQTHVSAISPPELVTKKGGEE